jgi:hypothetical protein
MAEAGGFLRWIAVRVGPRDPAPEDRRLGAEARALRETLERSGPVSEGAVRVLDVDESLTARLRVLARNAAHAMEIAKELYEAELALATDRELPPLDVEADDTP